MHQDNPWTTLARQEVYENPWIQLTEYQVLNPRGAPGIYGVVHFKNRAIGVLPVDGRGCTYLVGQYRYALGAYSWEIPMGGSPLDESPLEGAKRELVEETGLSARAWEPLMDLHTSNCVTDEVGHVFLAEDLQLGPSEPDETEQLAVQRLPLVDAVHMALDGRITDAISVAALLRLLHHPRYQGQLRRL